MLRPRMSSAGGDSSGPGCGSATALPVAGAVRVRAAPCCHGRATPNLMAQPLQREGRRGQVGPGGWQRLLQGWQTSACVPSVSHLVPPP